MITTRSARLWGAGAATACGVLAYFLIVNYRELIRGGSAPGLNPAVFYGLELVTLLVAAALTWRALLEAGRRGGFGAVLGWMLLVVATAVTGVLTVQVAYDVRTILRVGIDARYLRDALSYDLLPAVLSAAVALVASRAKSAHARVWPGIRGRTLALGLGFVAAQPLAVLLSLPPFARVHVLLTPGYRIFWLGVLVAALLLCWAVIRRAPAADTSTGTGSAGALGATLTLFSIAMVSTALRNLAFSAAAPAGLPNQGLRSTLLWVAVGAVFALLAARGALQGGIAGSPEPLEDRAG